MSQEAFLAHLDIGACIQAGLLQVEDETYEGKATSPLIARRVHPGDRPRILPTARLWKRAPVFERERVCASVVAERLLDSDAA